MILNSYKEIKNLDYSLKKVELSYSFVKETTDEELEDCFLTIYQKLENSGYLSFTLFDFAAALDDYKKEVITYNNFMSLFDFTEIKDDSRIKECIKSIGFQGINEEKLGNYFKKITVRKPLKLSAEYEVLGDRNILVNGDFTSYRSHGIICQQLLKELNKKVNNVFGWPDLLSDNNIVEVDACIKPLINYDNCPKSDDIIFRVDHITGLDGAEKQNLFNNRMIGYIFHEYTHLPLSWIQSLNKFEKVLVPSSFCAEVIRQSGYNNIVKVIPHGFDPSLYYKQEKNNEKFTFLTVGRQSKRKGTVELINAYKDTFSEVDNTKLIIKDILNNGNYDYASLIGDRPDIEVIKANYTNEQTAELIRGADCYVSPFYVEGFGMTLLEAKACGIPVVLTGFSGPMSFCTEEDSYIIKYNIEPRTENCPKNVNSFWAKPIESHLSFILREVYDNELLRNYKADKGYNSVKNLTWSAISDRILKEILF